MGKRLRDLQDRFSEYARRSLVLWLIFLLGGERATDAMNSFLDSVAVQYSPTLVAFIKSAALWLDNTGLGFLGNLTLLILLGILILSYWETRPQRMPTKETLSTGGNQIVKNTLKEKPSVPPLSLPTHFYPSFQIEESQLIRFSLAPERITKCIKFLKPFPADMPIKIVATQGHLTLAQQLVEILRLADRNVLFDNESKDYVFLARTTHNTIRLRASNLHFSSVPLLSAMSDLFPGAERREFPDSDEFNYFQIELGGAP
jgi:hypothetical protein